MQNRNTAFKKAKLCLGGVNFADPNYGHRSPILASDNRELIRAAVDLGITYFDTSPRYGRSESILGQALSQIHNKFIATKVDGLQPDRSNELAIRKSIERSLVSLNINKIPLLYLHQNEIEIIANARIQKVLLKMKEEGLVQEIGTSIYSSEELRYSISNPLFDWVQVPANVLDVSFVREIQANSTHSKKIAIRSIFLQGILLNDRKAAALLPNFDEFKSKKSQLLEISQSLGLAFHDMLVSYVVNHLGVDMVIVGSSAIHNLKMFKKATKTFIPSSAVQAIDEVSVSIKPWTNPRKWTN